MKFGIIVFPGSNCDHDVYHVISKVIGQPVEFLWHNEADLHNCDAVILPGGFSYGDYLRCGAIASFSPIMASVKKFAAEGGFVIGICNGFQILCEAKLLPGVLLKNKNLRFQCRFVTVRVENNSTPFTKNFLPNSLLELPIAHGEGNFFCSNKELEILEENKQIVFRYVDKSGFPTSVANPNGSLNNIAGITNKDGNILGLMPHPERASGEITEKNHGLQIFQSLLTSIKERIKILNN